MFPLLKCDFSTNATTFDIWSKFCVNNARSQIIQTRVFQELRNIFFCLFRELCVRVQCLGGTKNILETCFQRCVAAWCMEISNFLLWNKKPFQSSKFACSHRVLMPLQTSIHLLRAEGVENEQMHFLLLICGWSLLFARGINKINKIYFLLYILYWQVAIEHFGLFCHRKQTPLVYIYFYLIPAETVTRQASVPTQRWESLNRRIISRPEKVKYCRRQAGKSFNFSSPTPFLKSDYTTLTSLKMAAFTIALNFFSKSIVIVITCQM